MRTSGEVVEIAPAIFWVGFKDWQRRVFDALISLPYGTSYNAYLVVGGEKVGLVDSVAPGFEKVLLGKIAQVIAPEKIDYVVMNHAEPDHAGAIPEVLHVAPQARLATTQKGVDMAGTFYDIPPDRCIVVKDGDTLDLGGKTLRFIDAPWLHWPETMFTFAVEDRVLFPCDFFGAHMNSGRLFDDEAGDMVIPEAKRYYAEIMMPYQKMAARGLDKASALSSKIIAPSHGPVYRTPSRIISAYEKWVRGPLEKKALVLYVSMWGSTKRVAEAITAAISEEGVETVPYDLLVADVSHIARDLVDASGIVIGSPTLVGGPHPLATYVLSLVRALRPRGKLAGIFGSYGWGGGAVAQMKSQLESLGFEIVDTLGVDGAPKEKDLARARVLGQTMARRIEQTPG